MNAHMPAFSCIILAGGEGRRVGGKDKGLIKLDNKTYIEHVLDKVKNQSDDIIISANRNIDTYKTFCDKVIPDISSNYNGPLSGISSCLSHCKHEWVLIVPCDMPHLPDNVASQLFTSIQIEKISIATINNRHQLVMLIHQSVLHSLQEAMNAKQRKLIRWVESQNYCQVNFDSQSESFVNLNTLKGTSIN